MSSSLSSFLSPLFIVSSQVADGRRTGWAARRTVEQASEAGGGRSEPMAGGDLAGAFPLRPCLQGPLLTPPPPWLGGIKAEVGSSGRAPPCDVRRTGGRGGDPSPRHPLTTARRAALLLLVRRAYPRRPRRRWFAGANTCPRGHPSRRRCLRLDLACASPSRPSPAEANADGDSSRSTRSTLPDQDNQATNSC
uniref:Uncharacterized protein n=1 Tax=Oryza punctata TaxID=4537 RepID=A0A0E0LVH6_ORYPU